MKSKRFVILCIAAVALIGSTAIMLLDTNQATQVVASTTESAKNSVVTTTKKAVTTTAEITTTEPTTEETTSAPTQAPTTTQKATEAQTTTEKATTTTQATTKPVTTTTAPETTKKVTTTQAPQTTKAPETTKQPNTTKKDNVDSEEDDEIFIGSPSGTMPYETTTKVNKGEDLSKLGTETYGDIARAGKYYDENGNITTYDKIAEGEWYYYYDSDGDLHSVKKPYSKGNEPKEYRDHCIMCGYRLAGTEYYGADNCPSCKKFIGYNSDLGSYCEYCGKYCKGSDAGPACKFGGCTQWIKDVTCICGEKVPAHTCHTCKK